MIACEQGADTMHKRHLFVSGVARSGTSAFARLLNAHPYICLGLERFKFQILLNRNYDPTFFQKERFFDFRPGDTNLLPETSQSWREFYDTLWSKWDDAILVGDKVPDMTRHLGALLKAYENPRIIYIIRSLEGVAPSWEVRARNGKDVAWPQDKGYKAAIEAWCAQNESMVEHLSHPGFARRAMVIDYDTFFFEARADTAERIEAFLRLPHSDLFAAKLTSLIAANHQRIRNSLDRLDADACKAIAEADRTDFEQLKRHACQSS